METNVRSAMKLDEKALEAAEQVIYASKNVYNDKDLARNAIRAYLTSATPPDVAGLIERLDVRWEATDEPTARKINRFIRERKEAATALRLSAGGGWRPIDSAPKDGTHILVYCSRMGEVGEARWHSESFGGRGPTWVIAGFNQSWASEPTHWQPLPASPTVEGA